MATAQSVLRIGLPTTTVTTAVATTTAVVTASSTPVVTAPTISTTKGQSVVDIAKGYIGLIPYHLGASMTNTDKLAYADCSSFVKFVYGQVGYTLPRTANAQYKATQSLAIPNPSTKNLVPGDLLFFGGWNTPDNPPGYGGVQHVGIYMGNGYVIDEGAANTTNVGTAKLSSYGSHFLYATRPLTGTPIPTNPSVNSSALADPIAAVSDPIQKWATNSTDVFTAADKMALLAAIQGGTASGGTQVTTSSLDTILTTAVGKKYSDTTTQSAISDALTSTGFSKDSAGTIVDNYATDSSAIFTAKDFNTFLIASKLAAKGTPVDSTMGSIVTNLYPMIGKAYNDSSFIDAFKAAGSSTGLLPTDPLTQIAGILGKLTNPSNWLHLGAMLAGVALVGFGIYIGSKDLSETGPQGLVSPMPIILKEGA